ncbi:MULTISPECIES: TetR/AcrR family transcriptional regulator [Streptomyces]|uniref:TetR/AcrR family transcriptional regulator n=1 Tax=Streptomyces TaxID=1883 RepID=UPI00387EAA9F
MPAHPSHKTAGRNGEQAHGAATGASAGGPRTDAHHELRTDALRNRERLVEAAREVFAAQGVDAPLGAVARRAGVGMATLYRRFPTRSALVTAAYDGQLSACATALDEALADPDAGHGLYHLLETACVTLVTDRGFDTVFMTGFPEALDRRRERTRAQEALSVLVRRARETGRLREDFEPSDITLLLVAVSGLAGRPREVAVPAARRLLTYLFQSFQARPPARPGPLPPAPPVDPAGFGALDPMDEGPSSGLGG